MDTSHILQPTVSVRTPHFSKFMRFFGAIFLADLMFGNAINHFIEKLNQKGVLGLGNDFQTNWLLWGDEIWLNVLHIVVLGFTASLFGFFFGYLVKQLTIAEKLCYTTSYVFIRFLFIGVASLVIDNFFPKFSAVFNSRIGEEFFLVSSSVMTISLVAVGHIIMFAASIYFMNKGVEVINDPYHQNDKNEKGTFFDIKWYHYAWLIIPISFYSQVLLNLIYKIGHTIVTLITNFHWTTIFGVSDGEKGNAMDIAWANLFGVLIVTSIVFYLMAYLREILLGRTKQHWAIKTLIIFGISLVLPFLIAYFTNLAG